MKSYDLSVVMPVYNEAEAIGPVLKKWMAMLDTLGIRYRIRAYNDGSKDATGKILAEVADASDGRVLAVDKANSGHGPTILRGYREAAEDSDWVFQIDSDDEMGPESFPELWAKRNDYDFLVGRRDGRRQPLARKVVSFVSRLSVRLFYGKGIWDVNTPYRLMRAEVFAPFYAQIPDDTFAPNVILSGLAARHRLRLLEIPVPQHDRTTGEVSIKKWKLLKAAARSFAQTIAFSLPANAPQSKGFAKIVEVGAACLGIFFCAFLLCGPYRLISLPFVVLFLLALLRLRNSCVLAWIIRHPSWTVGIVIVLGLLVRGAFLLVYPEYLTFTGQGPDAQFFATRIDALLQGEMLPTKSWTSVFYYTGVAALLGNTIPSLLVGSLILSGVAILLAFCLGRHWLGVLGGVVFAACLALSPFLAMHNLQILSEHMYCVTLLAALLFGTLAYEAKTIGKMSLWGVLFGITAWLTVWSRTEGILLWVLFPGLFVVAGMTRRVSWKKVVVFLAIAGILFAAGGTLACEINRRIDGSCTIFCSNDGLIPRLMGTQGSWNGDLLAQVQDDYRQSRGLPKDYPIQWGCGDEDWANYLRETITERWRAMTFMQKVQLIWDKVYATWLTPAMPPRSVADAIGKMSLGLFTAFLAFTSLIVFVLHLLRGRMMEPYCLWSGVLFIVGNMVALFVSESNWRYSLGFHLLFGMYVALLVSWLLVPVNTRLKMR